ncbi:RNA polymerase sporulation sigma factor SigH [Acidiferrimicrobium sp. IK]|uniref:RNA polymerase sporulation sigma factor SigH n=1 Tax=Acidiferrimicrobium sp. IK TaxID=2871700 RepID=UPI0021CAE7D5|nr:RNA polymerase sporulation sigma factor SigH [Acidiferrimicrobium sp. IK]MCU4186964.1 RNA polymerase sporulation sigma factor SigH [Acidiferrimicrobium sp. IK]
MAIRSIYQPLTDQTDEELVARWQGGDEVALEELLLRYRRFARAKARTYFLVGADADDIEQEGLIGLYKAARDFQADRQVSFRAFAELCVTRQVISAIKAATRQKHQPLNRYVSISAARGGDDAAERTVEDLLDDHRIADPADEVISREQLGAMRATVAGALSGFEVEVLRLYVEGTSYQEIGLRLGRHVKSIDNALQRIKRKLDQQLRADPTEDLALAS